MLKSSDLVNKAKNIAKNYKTLYVMGCYGSPLTASNKNRFLTNHDYNKRLARQVMIKGASPDTFGFDCSGLIKAIFWGWCGDYNNKNGGAVYASNGLSDINADTMIKRCSNVSKDFSNIVPGELLHLQGHIGIYIGNGLAVECTPSFDNCVQITSVANMGTNKGAKYSRKWLEHGRFNYVDYSGSKEAEKTATDIAKEVIAGKWGTMPERKKLIEAAGYNYESVRVIVNRLLKGVK